MTVKMNKAGRCRAGLLMWNLRKKITQCWESVSQAVTFLQPQMLHLKHGGEISEACTGEECGRE